MNAAAAAQPAFSPRAVLGLVLFGAITFVVLLWMIGTGIGAGGTNNGGAHAGGKGLNGYAAFAGYLEQRGFAVRRLRNEGGLDDPGLLVLSPPAFTDGNELQKVYNKRRYIGPTLVITPKWQALQLPTVAPGAKAGWVTLPGTQAPEWRGFLDTVTVQIAPVRGSRPATWSGAGLSGKLPVPDTVLSGQGPGLVPLVSASDGRMLAAYLLDDGIYPALERLALEAPRSSGEDKGLYPLLIVFEPDLLDNYGMADAANARLGERLVRAALASSQMESVSFDLTQNGLGHSDNLLTLAFTPPFLAATLCLLMAALAVGWRGFVRFGPAQAAVRAIAFGKRALVANAAGLIRRAGRLHLVAEPYATAARERLARALALPRLADAAAAEAAIDRALAARDPAARPFSTVAARLRAARRPADMLRAAQELHSIERILTQ
jgi:hypothetical protein